MAIVTSKKATEKTIKDFKFYTGVIPYKVVAVNPNLAELNELGINYLKEEPNYVHKAEYDGVEVINTNVEFWVKSIPNEEHPDMDILVPVRFRINHKEWVGQSGKKQFINKYGRTTWGMDIPALDSNAYYLNEGSRPAHRGEEDLHKFLFAWLNMVYDTVKKEYDECLVDVNQVVAGTVTELKAIVKSSPEYIVKCLTGVNVVEKDGKIRYYQQIYNQMFLKHNQTSTNRLEEFVTRDQYTEFKGSGDLYFTYDLQEFNKSVKPDEDSPSSDDPITDAFGSSTDTDSVF